MKNISLKLMKMSLQTKNNPTHHLLFWYLASFRLLSKLILSACLKYYPVDGKLLFFILHETDHAYSIWSTWWLHRLTTDVQFIAYVINLPCIFLPITWNSRIFSFIL